MNTRRMGSGRCTSAGGNDPSGSNVLADTSVNRDDNGFVTLLNVVGSRGLVLDRVNQASYNRYRLITRDALTFASRDPLGYRDGGSLYIAHHYQQVSLDPTGRGVVQKIEPDLDDPFDGFSFDMNVADVGEVCPYSPEQVEECRQLRRRIYKHMQTLRRRMSKYDPYDDFVGGWPYSAGGVKKYTKPFEHYHLMMDDAARLNRLLFSYWIKCRGEPPAPNQEVLDLIKDVQSIPAPHGRNFNIGRKLPPLDLDWVYPVPPMDLFPFPSPSPSPPPLLDYFPPANGIGFSEFHGIHPATSILPVAEHFWRVGVPRSTSPRPGMGLPLIPIFIFYELYAPILGPNYYQNQGGCCRGGTA